MQANTTTRTLSDSEIRDYLEDLVIGSELSEEKRQQKLDELRSGVFGPDHDRLLFPTKLFKLVSCQALFPDIFWLDDDNGDISNAFAIDRVGFQQHIMSIFFKQRKLKSFQNALSRYRFHKIVPAKKTAYGQDAGELIVYSHPLFKKGHQELAREIMPARNASRQVQANRTAPPQEMIAQEEECPNIQQADGADRHMQEAVIPTEQANLQQQQEINYAPPPLLMNHATRNEIVPAQYAPLPVAINNEGPPPQNVTMPTGEATLEADPSATAAPSQELAANRTRRAERSTHEEAPTIEQMQESPARQASLQFQGNNAAQSNSSPASVAQLFEPEHNANGELPILPAADTETDTLDCLSVASSPEIDALFGF